MIALILLDFANRVGPAKFGETTLPMLAITYSIFIIMGVNGSFIKFHSLSSQSSEKKYLSTFNFFYNLIFSLLLIIIVTWVTRADYAIFVGLISGFNLVRGSIQSILRAKQYVFELAVYNFLFAVIFGISYINVIYTIQGVDINSFFQVWAYSLFGAIVIGCVFLYRKSVIYSIINLKFLIYFRDNIKRIVTNGIILVIMGACALSFISFDRIVLLIVGIEMDLIGRYQYAENISNIFYRGFNTLIYLLNPIYISKLSKQQLKVKTFIDRSQKIAFLGLLFVVAYAFVAKYGIREFAPDYDKLFFLILELTMVKYLLLLMFIPFIIHVAFNKEKSLLIKYLTMAIILIIFQLGLVILLKENSIYYLPMVSMFVLFALYFISMNKIYE
jgi:hypothetical protein